MATLNSNPSNYAKFILLCRQDHAAGALLERINHWHKYGKATIPKQEGTWCANPREWWAREAAMTPRMYDRAIAKLKKLKLVEKHMWWFGKGEGVPVSTLHLRPTKRTTDFIQNAKDKPWDEVVELLSEASE